MEIEKQSLLTRWWRQLFPPMPDFYQLLNAQCDLLVEGTQALYDYMNSGEISFADRVLELEHNGEKLKAENMVILHRAFTTPYDREDIYRSITALHDILDYANTTVSEMRTLKLNPDEHTLVMAELLHQGALSLQQGYARLQDAPLLAEQDATEARTKERTTEHFYRKAIGELFDAGHYLETQTPQQQETESSMEVLVEALPKRETEALSSAIGFVVEAMKRREIYRHMSNSADRLVRAADVLEDIVAKIA